MTEKELTQLLDAADKETSLCLLLKRVRALAERDHLSALAAVVAPELEGYRRVADLPKYRKVRASFGYRTRTGRWVDYPPLPIRPQDWIKPEYAEPAPTWSLPWPVFIPINGRAPVMFPLARVEEMVHDAEPVVKPVEFDAPDALLDEMGLRAALPATRRPKVPFWRLDLLAGLKGPEDPPASGQRFRFLPDELPGMLGQVRRHIVQELRDAAIGQGLYVVPGQGPKRDEDPPPEPIARDPDLYPSPIRDTFYRRLGPDWQRLADYLGIPPHDQGQFEKGIEARGIWQWLGRRGRLLQLENVLVRIDRGDLAKELRGGRSPE
jgi:hypothetical protein